jgi:hypothetical protein
MAMTAESHLPKRTWTVLGKQGAKGGPPETLCALTGEAALALALFPPHGNVENGPLAVDQEQGKIARLHRVGEALKG